MNILIASNNNHKIQEIDSICESVLPGYFKFYKLDDIISEPFDVEETGTTLEENAILKAKAYYQIAKIPVLADDTGLEVRALDYKPGVYSARYSGNHGDDAANRSLLLKNMESESDRYAHFRTVLCFYDGVKEIIVEGKCSGKIALQEIGDNGFGYDSIFIPEGYTETFAQLSAVEKNTISHRFKAVINFAKLFV